MSSVSLRKATVQDIPLLDDVERSAAHIYKTTSLSAITNTTLGEASLKRMLKTNTVWLACVHNEIAGFAAGFPNGRLLHLQELSVGASFQRQGIGRRLLSHVIDNARDGPFDGVSLCTFRDLPWCRPFYEMLGFCVVEEPEMTTGLLDIWRRDCDEFPRDAPRVAMMLTWTGNC